MKIQSPPGMRDFYPAEMRVQNWLFDAWRRVSRAFGFQEYEGPIFEFLELYTLKSGEGIVGDLFTFQDRGDRRFAIRAEMTPTLARMVAARANALPRPIKWFSVPRMCRAERPQRGRLREFYQWNVDTLGVDDVLADAEVIAVVVAFFRAIGLTPADVVIRFSSRPLVGAILSAIGVAPELHDAAIRVIDRMEKLKPQEFEESWQSACGGAVSADAFRALLGELTFERLAAGERLAPAGTSAPDASRSPVGSSAGGARSAAVRLALPDDVLTPLRALRDHLTAFGAADWCAFDLRVVRGLAYYTGIVFEAYARDVQVGALAGGGRYDNLVGLLDGPPIGGVGFGMGDARIVEVLSELGRMPRLEESLDVFVIDADPALFSKALEIVGTLRRAGLAVEFSFKRQPVGKQFKQASARGARFAVIVGTELTDRGEVALKDMQTQTQRTLGADALAAELSAGRR
ncbi:MAG: histidine--tRNA ligase [Phycisphaerae bacterium]